MKKTLLAGLLGIGVGIIGSEIVRKIRKPEKKEVYVVICSTIIDNECIDYNDSVFSTREAAVKYIEEDLKAKWNANDAMWWGEETTTYSIGSYEVM